MVSRCSRMLSNKGQNFRLNFPLNGYSHRTNGLSSSPLIPSHSVFPTSGYTRQMTSVGSVLPTPSIITRFVHYGSGGSGCQIVGSNQKRDGGQSRGGRKSSHHYQKRHGGQKGGGGKSRWGTSQRKSRINIILFFRMTPIDLVLTGKAMADDMACDTMHKVWGWIAYGERFCPRSSFRKSYGHRRCCCYACFY